MSQIDSVTDTFALRFLASQLDHVEYNNHPIIGFLIPLETSMTIAPAVIGNLIFLPHDFLLIHREIS